MSHRRGNGLPAASYVPLAPLPPTRADRLLEVLRRAGIAAYAIPHDTDDQSPATGGTEAATAVDPQGAAPPVDRDTAEPVDRVYVDAEAIASARDILHRHLVASGEPEAAETPEPSSHDPGEDEQWRDLVARFYESEAADAPVWPDAENVGGASGRAAAQPPDGDEPARETPAEEEHYIPPPPPPIPSGTLLSRLAWTGVLGGPALALVMVVFLGQTLPPWLGFCIVAGFIAGFVVLVLRMEDRPSRPSDPDDGTAT